MRRKSLIITHNPTEGGGLFETILKAKGWQHEILPLYAGKGLPESVESYDLILLMGGPMSANEEERYPFLKKELPFIRQVLKLGKPVLGICLGAQLMAKSLGARVTYSLEEAVAGADVIMMLRLQLERMGQMFLSTLREYSRFFGLAPRHLQLAQPDVIIMHPGPLNRGVEISPEVADGPHSVILEQVTNGVAVRMAMLYLLIGGEKA